MRHLGAGWSVVLGLAVGACGGCPPKPEPEPGPNGGQGTIKIGGTDKAYTVATDESSLLILVKKLPSGGTLCGSMHDHAIRSTSTRFAFALNKDTAAASTLEATVFAFGLEADHQEDRDQFDRTRGDTGTAGFESDIQDSTRDHLKAEQFPEIVFRVHDLTTLDGSGTAPVDVRLKGTESTFTLTGTAVWAGEKLTIEGTGSIDGTRHSIPEQGENFSECVEPSMDLKMKLVFAPGASDGGVEAPDAGPGARVFPDDAPCGPTGFSDVEPILVRSCAGCHSDPSIGLVGTPLTTFTQFRTSTRLEPETPLYAQALERITLDVFDARVMPPPADGLAITPAEVAVVRAWVDSGAHEFKCDGMGQPITPPDVNLALTLTPPACGTLAFTQVQAVINAHGCLGCHMTAQAGRPRLTEIADGMAGNPQLLPAVQCVGNLRIAHEGRHHAALPGHRSAGGL